MRWFLAEVPEGRKPTPAPGNEAKRRLVSDHHEGTTRPRYDELEGTLVLLDTILGNGWIRPGETLQHQRIGVTFGDALAQQLHPEWWRSGTSTAATRPSPRGARRL
jgi:hypothetical protein